MADTATYKSRRSELETYFNQTARAAWERLTSDAPVSRIRETVRQGRDEMRGVLLDWLPADLSGARLLDAGCGVGALSVEAARRGAEVVAIDVAEGLVRVAEERAAPALAGAAGSVRFLVGDMADPALGRFDHVVAMDSLIHYRREDVAAAVRGLAARAEKSVLFTFAPWTPPLAAMHAAGRLFPRADRAPSVEPVAEARLRALLGEPTGAASALRLGRDRRVAKGFYISHALEVLR